MENYIRINFNNNTILNLNNTTYLIHFMENNMLINAKIIFQSDEDITFSCYHKTHITDYIDPNEIIWQPYRFDIIINKHLFINNRVILYTTIDNNNELVNPQLNIHNPNIFTPIPRSRSPSPVMFSPYRTHGGKNKKRKRKNNITKSKRKRRKKGSKSLKILK